VLATLISTSRPSLVNNTPSALSQRSLPRRLTIASTVVPRWRTRSTVRLVSVVVPDCEIATISVSRMSSVNANPDSSVAGIACTAMPVGSKASAIAAATAWPATAAVPWPITSTRRTRFSCRACTVTAGSEAGGKTTCRRLPWRTMRPRSVFCSEFGASPISFSRKWRNVPRSMSRVVTAARDRFFSVSGNGVPSYAQRVMPASSPALARSRITIWPREAPGFCGLPGVSPSMRR
jgi:hypothetical protein